MVTRKPIGSPPIYRQSSTEQSQPSNHSEQAYALENEWATPNNPDPAHLPRLSSTEGAPQQAFETEDVAPGASTEAWKITDPLPQAPILAVPEIVAEQPPSQDSGDFGIGSMSLRDSVPPPFQSPPNTNSTNPFLRKRSSPSVTPAVPTEETSQNIWGEPVTATSSTSHPPQLDPIPQEALLKLDAEDPWGEARASTPSSLPALASTSTAPQNEGASVNVSKGKAPATSQPHIDIPPPMSGSRPEVETPMTKARRERNEVYQIKHIRWFDANAEQNPRHSPILTQNANGPCPLLALVNALVLSTPADLITPLVETLRTREQVSLGLLIDAVFDELMSERRSGNSPNLPDVGDLYAFLVTLHTGMNVNPRFVPTEWADERQPGDFEETREMKLYSCFAIPLIHGWMPPRHEQAWDAFSNSAQSYEDAQNLLFREEDLEQKFTLGVITGPDQNALVDLSTIKKFLVDWPTQLTTHGLDVIKGFLTPGAMAILFRNDHFSLIYKEPTGNRLMTLVTDAGYATHDEIVWESLVDINGTDSELYSGDFRSVSHEEPRNGTKEDREGWETVKGKGSRRPPVGENNDGAQSHPATLKALEAGAYSAPSTDFNQGSSALSAAEQEDHDLALALQLQEEEEEQQRNEAAIRRARENDLSEQFISQEVNNVVPRAPGQAPAAGGLRIPPRRSGPQQATVTPAGAAAALNSAEDNAPPPYEQAASSTPFIPPRSHPASEHAPLTPTGSMSQASLSNVYAQSTNSSGAGGSAGRRRQGSSRLSQSQGSDPRGQVTGRRAGRVEQTAAAEREREEKCVVM